MIWLRLFWEFFKTGLFAVGGGMATVPFLQDISARTGWFTQDQLLDLIAVSESTPGPIGVNMATYVGFTVGEAQGGVLRAVLGAAVATLGLITPSVVIIMIVALFLRRFRESSLVDAAFYGLRPASVALISAAGVNVFLKVLLKVDSVWELSKAVLSWKTIALAAVVYLCTNHAKKLKKLHPIWFIAFSALAGILLRMGRS